MKKSLPIISSILLLSAMLAACNTETEQTTNPSANETTETTETESTENDTTTNVEETTTNEQADEHAEQTSFDNTSAETAITYTSKGEAVTEKTITSTSNELGYSISHLESYTLESEEPGVDRLLYNDDNALSMQIKVASTEETTFDDVKASSKETITAIASEGNYNELNLADISAVTSDIKNIIGYETVIDSEKITIVTFEKGSKIITLTIYDTVEADLTDAFLNMGLTIQ